MRSGPPSQDRHPHRATLRRLPRPGAGVVLADEVGGDRQALGVSAPSATSHAAAVSAANASCQDRRSNATRLFEQRRHPQPLSAPAMRPEAYRPEVVGGWIWARPTTYRSHPTRIPVYLCLPPDRCTTSRRTRVARSRVQTSHIRPGDARHPHHHGVTGTPTSASGRSSRARGPRAWLAGHLPTASAPHVPPGANAPRHVGTDGGLGRCVVVG